MKGDIYYLKNKKDGMVSHKFEVADDDFCLRGRCYEAYTWELNGTPCEYSFVAGVYCKWDACTHWYFYGEDYRPDVDDINERDQDSYYHLCGGFSFMNHITAMCFVWKLAEQILAKDPQTIKHNNVKYIHDEYYDYERIEKLIDLVLDGYEIVKA